MESEQSTNQKCLDFLEGAEEQRQKLSESLEEEFEVTKAHFRAQKVKIGIMKINLETNLRLGYA